MGVNPRSWLAERRQWLEGALPRGGLAGLAVSEEDGRWKGEGGKREDRGVHGVAGGCDRVELCWDPAPSGTSRFRRPMEAERSPS